MDPPPVGTLGSSWWSSRCARVERISKAREGNRRLALRGRRRLVLTRRRLWRVESRRLCRRRTCARTRQVFGSGCPDPEQDQGRQQSREHEQHKNVLARAALTGAGRVQLCDHGLARGWMRWLHPNSPAEWSFLSHFSRYETIPHARHSMGVPSSPRDVSGLTPCRAPRRRRAAFGPSMLAPRRKLYVRRHWLANEVDPGLFVPRPADGKKRGADIPRKPAAEHSTVTRRRRDEAPGRSWVDNG